MSEFLLRPDVPMIKPVKMRANVGACLDIPTGVFLKGRHGESVLNGGIPLIFALTGKSNNFKSTILAYMLLTALYRLTKNQSSLSWYDTEVNVDLPRLAYIASLIEGYENFSGPEDNVFQKGLWVFSDKENISGNKWFDRIHMYVNEKRKAERQLLRDSPFLDLDGKTLIRYMLPSASALDSITEFESEDVTKMREETEIGESDANTLNLRQGLGKDRLIRELTTLTSRGNHFFGICAQFGEEKGMQNSRTPPTKVMNTMRQNEKIRGVPESFRYLTQHIWRLDGSEQLMDDSKTNAEYPLEENNFSEALDLYRTPVTMLRSKTGIAGFTVNVLVSQKRGVQPTLTEYYNLNKIGKEYGQTKTVAYSHELDLYPGVNHRRTTVRKIIGADPLFRRAVNMTSELLQIENFHEGMKGKVPPPKEIYNKLKADGYDWDLLLRTRGWWTFDNDKQELPYLSSMDLVNMYNGEYVPFWLTEDKKSVRKEFLSK